MLRKGETDILIDLKVLRGETRPGICRAASVPHSKRTISAYPGTMAADYYDYRRRQDRHPGAVAASSLHLEQIAYLPDSYQCNDAKREMSARLLAPRGSRVAPTMRSCSAASTTTTRILAARCSTSGCAFCAPFDNSVLWLLQDNPAVPRNLLPRSDRRGIAPEAAQDLCAAHNTADQLARQKLADLFLDTLPYNAHTTCSDAVWAGLTSHGARHQFCEAASPPVF